MVIGYLLRITFDKYWSHDFRSVRGVSRTLETAVYHKILRINHKILRKNLLRDLKDLSQDMD